MNKLFQDSIHETDEVNEEDRASCLQKSIAARDRSPQIKTEDVDDESSQPPDSYKEVPSFGAQEEANRELDVDEVRRSMSCSDM